MQYEEDCFVLICDRDLRYARHLQEYLLSEGGLSCSVRILTDPGQLEKGGGKDKAMFLILSESLQGSWMETMEPDRILILSESGAFPENGPACVSKYQPARCLVEALLRLPGAGSLQTGASIRHGSPLEMIGFYTPVSRALQTSLALTMGQLLSEEGSIITTAHRKSSLLCWEPWRRKSTAFSVCRLPAHPWSWRLCGKNNGPVCSDP